MSSPCTSLVRCRVKDLASCFYACRFPLDEESSDTIHSTFPQMQTTSMAANSKCSRKTHYSGMKIAVADKICNEEEKDEYSSAQRLMTPNSTTNDNEAEEGSRDPKWPRFSEEDYIVFCFREDGAIHMINESKPSKTYDHDNNKKGKEEWSNDMKSEWPENEIKEIDSATIGAKGCEEDSFESCDSNQSDTSTNSFSFPKLGIEWIGSPVHMPKSEKHKATCVLLHCCRF